MIRGDAIDWMALFGAAALTMLLILLLRPLLRRYALARPNARSSHREPTPQGGGIAVIGATIARSRGCPAHSLPRFVWAHWRSIERRYRGGVRALRRDARLCTVQPSSGSRIPRRCRQPTDRLVTCLAAGTACPTVPDCSAIATIILLGGRDHHIAASVCEGRAGHASTSQPFLSTSDRQRLQRHRDRRPCVRRQCPFAILATTTVLMPSRVLHIAALAVGAQPRQYKCR